jgi:POT family proton-dependent oligopeptide transporter
METDFFPRLSAVNRDEAATNLTVNRQMEVSLLILSPMLTALIILLPILIPLLFTQAFLPIVSMSQMAVLAMFFVKALNMGDAQSFIVFGAFSAMVYGYVSIGGYIGDKVLGTQRTIALGAIVLMIGYAMMAFAASGERVEENLVFLALGAIACGNGIFKANPSSLLSKIYEGDEQHLDSAVTMYYMAVNIGSFVSMLLVPIVGAMYGLYLGFSICAMGLIVAIGGFFSFRYLV